MRIGINGCGVAGPTLAFWLRHYGHEPVLFEKAPALRDGGYVIDFWGSGYKVAERMGIVPALREDALIVEQVQAVDAQGKVTTSLGVDALADMLGGNYFSIARSDLARHIYEACDDKIETHFGCSLETIVDAGDEVRAERTDGKTDRFDLLVGADGLHSDVRRQVFGAAAQFEQPLGLHVAAFVLDGYRPRTERAYVQFTRPDRQISRAALRDDKTLVLMVFADHLLAGEIDEEADQKNALRRIFGGIGWESDAILARLDQVEDVYFDTVSQIVMPRWTDGRIALVGDAAACASLLAGEGTGLAMTEAYVLAGELHRAQGDHLAAFAAYEQRLRDYVAAKQKAARSFKSFFAPTSEFGVILREWGMKLASVPYLTRLLLGAGMTNQMELPDYD